MTVNELNKKVQAIEKKALSEIELLKREFEISEETPNVKCSVFDGFILFYCDTREQIQEVLTAFPAVDRNEPNPFYGYEKIPYSFQYHIGIDNNINDIVGRINYSSSLIGDVWIKFNPLIIEDYLSFTSRKIYETELHHFPGQSRQQIGKIRAMSFCEKGIKYYGGDEKLKCEETARKLIDLFTNADVNQSK